MTNAPPTSDDPAHPPAESRTGSGGFASRYRPTSSAADEMIDADGSLRPHWRSLTTLLDDLGPHELDRRWADARRLMHDNGVTHNVYGDPDGLDRPWTLDPLPLPLPAAEWAGVCAALEQRARLLDALLADLYGPARTVDDRVLPSALIWANDGFLRPCHGVLPPLGRWLHLYAADLIRAPDGHFEVLTDRTQNPSGAGYALENRIVLSRSLGSVYRHCNVQRLAPHFIRLRETLALLAPPHRRENLRVAMLTPGPYNETYFEHAYLARYLGYPLVQGSDLTVRDAAVYLKTLGGLQRIDVLLRRVDDDFCDPLELIGGSRLGAPGLLQAIRAGNVAVANALGSGVLQAPGFLPFLPALCRHLLGEELRLPSVQTWWCGDASSRAYVLDHLSDLVVKSAFPVRGEDPIFASELTRAEASELAARIRARPERYVAQARVMDRTTPALIGGRLEPRRFVTRAYLAAHADGGYVAMAGGLTRIAASGESRSVSLQRGAGSKDTWVLSEAPVLPVTLLPSPHQPVALSRGGGDLPSRVADDLFWLGRYVERTEATVRLGRGALSRLLDPNGADVLPVVRRLLVGVIPPYREARFGSLERELLDVLFDPRDPASLVGAAGQINRLARLLRDRISIDAWRVLQAIGNAVIAFDAQAPDDDGLADPTRGAPELFDGMVARCAAFAGLVADSMTRGQSWLFVDLGRRLERAARTARLLRDTVASAPEDPVLLESVLEITDSSMTYRRRYLTHMEPHAVVDLLLADDANPRAIAFQLLELERHLAQLPRDPSQPARNGDQQQVLRLRAAIETADVQALCSSVRGTCPQLTDLLNDAIERLEALSQTIAQLYFSHSAVTREIGAELDVAAPHGEDA